MSKRPPSSVAILLFLSVLLGTAPIARAQEEAPPPVTARAQDPALDAEKIKARIGEVEKDESLAEDTKKKVLANLNDALKSIANAEQYRERIAGYKRSITEAPEATQKIRAELAQPVAEPEAGLPAGISLEDAKLAQQKAKSDLVTARNDEGKQGEVVRALGDRPKAIATEQNKAEQDIEEVEKELAAEPAPDTPEQRVTSRRVKLLARQEELYRQREMLEQELLSQPMRLQLATATQELAKRRLDEQVARVAAIDEIVSPMVRAETEAAKQRTERESAAAADEHPVVRAAAAANKELTERLAQVVADQTPATETASQFETQLSSVKGTYDRIRGQLDASGLRGLSGTMLRKQRARLTVLLDDLAKSKSRWRGRLADAESYRLELFLMERELADPKAATEAILSGAEPALKGAEREQAATEIGKLLETRKDLVQRLTTAYGELLGTLQTLGSNQTKLEAQTVKFAALLDEWLLWMPSTTAPGKDAASHLVNSFAWLFSPTRWSTAEELLVGEIAEHWLLTALALLALVVMVAARRPARARLEAIAGDVRRISTDRLALTWQALGLLAVLTAPLPFLFAALALALQASGGAPSIAAGLSYAAVTAFFIVFISGLCAPRGIGELHFKWRSAATAVMHRNLRWVLWPLVVAAFLVQATSAQPNQEIRDSLGRTAFIVAMLVLVVFWQHLLRPNGDVMQPTLARRPNGWLARLKWLWYPVAVATPLTLAVIAFLGYYYTALELDGSLFGTIVLFVVVMLARAIAVRWLLIEQRRMAVAQFVQQRESAPESATVAGEEGEMPIPDEFEVDLSQINDQTRKLVRTASVIAFVLGVWGIWYDMLPALGVLDRVQLWTQRVIAPDGTEGTGWTTLQDIVIAVVALIVTGTAARNLPGLLQITVLKNLPLEPGAGYAIVTIVRYVLTFVGVFAAFHIIHFSWSSVQWLVAALGVGIGFGLQEVIANFVCGLILLFERPVRIGDSVTIGDASGTVSRIRIRATTIMDWDRKEMVIPNKELITGRVLNWTLSSSLNRVMIHVGVAYGTDTERARQLLMKTASSHPKVLEDPAPLATFEGFGDSTLNFVLRAYLANYDGRLSTISELHTAVDEAFKAAGIEIAFPQLDLHLRTAEAALRVENERTATITPAPHPEPGSRVRTEG